MLWEGYLVIGSRDDISREPITPISTLRFVSSACERYLNSRKLSKQLHVTTATNFMSAS